MDFKEQYFDYSAGRSHAPTLTVMVGVSGSGKSYLAKQWVSKSGGNTVRLNRDNLRAMVYGDVPWSNHNEKYIRQLELDAARLALNTGKSVIVDDTNCKVRTRHTFEELARDCRAKFRLVVMTTPLDDCIDRDKMRVGKERVGETVIRIQLGDLMETSVTPRAYNLDMTPNRATQDAAKLQNREFVFRLPKAKTVIFDIDGTLSDLNGDEECCGVKTMQVGKDKTIRKCSVCHKVSGRSPFDESKVLTDKPYQGIIDIANELYAGHNLVLMSGRHAGCCEDTVTWMGVHGVPFDCILMRREGDNRGDGEVKPELLDILLTMVDKDDIAFVVDDRPRVIEVWKQRGLKVRPVFHGELVEGWTTEHTPTCTFDRSIRDHRRCPECGAVEYF